MPKTYNCYRIVEVDDSGNYKTLFHGIAGSRQLPVGKWLKAVKKMVSDGSGTEYLSGFHVLKTLKDCEEYLKKFRNVKTKKIISIQARGLRRKTHSRHPVFLASYMKICLEQIQE